MRRTLLLPLIALTLAACAAETTSPATAGVVASYIAAVPAQGSAGPPYGALVVTTTKGGVISELPVAGAEIRLVLDASGSTTGRVFIPAAATGTGANVDADLVGTWSLADGIVTLHQTADTFLRDMPLTVQGDGLVGDRTFDGTRVRLTLVRQVAP